MEIEHVFGIHTTKLFLDVSALDGPLFVVTTDIVSNTVFLYMAASNLDDYLLICHALIVEFLASSLVGVGMETINNNCNNRH